jgi:hypothetical protein
MNAKQAREYAQKKLTVVEGKNKDIFEDILSLIKACIDSDPTKTYAIIDAPPAQVIAWLESKEYGYETAPCKGAIENSLKVSWSEEGIKQYGHYDK